MTNDEHFLYALGAGESDKRGSVWLPSTSKLRDRYVDGESFLAIVRGDRRVLIEVDRIDAAVRGDLIRLEPSSRPAGSNQSVAPRLFVVTDVATSGDQLVLTIRMLRLSYYD